MMEIQGAKLLAPAIPDVVSALRLHDTRLHLIPAGPWGLPRRPTVVGFQLVDTKTSKEDVQLMSGTKKQPVISHPVLEVKSNHPIVAMKISQSSQFLNSGIENSKQEYLCHAPKKKVTLNLHSAWCQHVSISISLSKTTLKFVAA